MHPESQVREVLNEIQPTTIHGPYSRCVGYHHLVSRTPGSLPERSPQPLWGMGSANSGARFTPRGGFETVYLAEDPVTALAEAALVISHPQAPPLTFRTPPWVHIAVDGVLIAVLDLSKEAIRTALGTNLQELTGEWRYSQDGSLQAPTQSLGRLCFETTRYDGIRFCSSKNHPHGLCVAVFTERLKSPAYIEVYDPYDNLAQRLP
jgi:RES domain-containing protein